MTQARQCCLTCALHRICFQAGSQAPLQHIHAEFTDIKARNEAQQARVEDILSQRLALEQQTKQVGAALTAETLKFKQAGHLKMLAKPAQLLQLLWPLVQPSGTT
jgi:hypothetical protein